MAKTLSVQMFQHRLLDTIVGVDVAKVISNDKIYFK